MLKKMSRAWLIGILLFLPFQLRIAQIVEQSNDKISALIRYVDEITIVFFCSLCFIEFWRTKKQINRIYLLLILSLLAFSVFGIVSGVINGNSLFITSLGIFDYIKGFLLIFIYAAFLGSRDDFKRIFSLMLWVAVFLGFLACVQEFWALFSRYILSRDIYDERNYLLAVLPSKDDLFMFKDFWRLGIYRASALTIHPNTLGLYSTLILGIYLFTAKRIKPFIFFTLFTGVFVSVSRIIYVSFLLLAGVQILHGKRWLLAAAFPILMLLFSMSSLPDSKLVLPRLQGDKIFQEDKAFQEDKIFRVYAKNKAMQVWKDHPFIGIGPGMFGGVISITFNSPVYGEYDFSQKWFNYMKPFRSLDQFWPQALAEVGVLGTLTFLGLLFSLFLMFFKCRQSAVSEEVKNFFRGLTVIAALIFLYTIGSGLNNTSFLFTFFALSGMGLGNYENSSH